MVKCCPLPENRICMICHEMLSISKITCWGVSGCYGGMAERLKAHVLKTCLGHTNVGSNPTPSADHPPVVTTLRSALRVSRPKHKRLKSLLRKNLGRCQSGRMGPPAK